MKTFVKYLSCYLPQVLVIALLGSLPIGNAQAEPTTALKITLQDGDIVKTRTGAVFLIRLGFKYRISDEESLKAYVPDPGALRLVEDEVLAAYDKGGEAPKRRIVTERVYADVGTKTKSVVIPNGWKFLSHQFGVWKKNGGDKSVKLQESQGKVSAVIIKVTGYGDTRLNIMGFPTGSKTKKNQKQQGAEVTVVMEEEKSVQERREVD